MNTTTTTTTTPTQVRISAYNSVTRRLGNWTTATDFQVRGHRGVAVLDLRSPQIPAGDIRVEVDLDHAVLKLLVPDDAVVDDWDLERIGRGRVKGYQPSGAASGRRIVLTGRLRRSEIRAARSGIAILTAMFSREYIADVRRAHRDGGFPTVDDPTRTV